MWKSFSIFGHRVSYGIWTEKFFCWNCYSLWSPRIYCWWGDYTYARMGMWLANFFLLLNGLANFSYSFWCLVGYWQMMKNMKLQEGNTVILKNTQVPRATYVKLQPHTKDFLDISNPKSMYECATYSCFFDKIS